MKKVMIIGGLLVVAFLAGYVPLCLKNNDLQSKADVLEGDLKYAGLRVEAGMILMEVEKGDFGRARTRSTRFFDGVREYSDSSPAATKKTALQGILKHRDSITAALAALDPGVAGTLRSIYVSMEPVTPQ